MTPVLWIIIALLVAGALVFASSLRTRKMLPPVRLPDGEKLPKTILQKRAAGLDEEGLPCKDGMNPIAMGNSILQPGGSSDN